MYRSSTANVVIIGASTRAAAFSAVRAGLRPRCLDQYADADLAAVAPTDRIKLPDVEAGLVSAEDVLDGSPWIYTGPVENHPGLVERLSAAGRLLGNDAETLRAVRDPWRVAESLARRGLASPSLARASDGPPRRGRWLVKPLASAGGRSIGRADAPTSLLDGSYYYQEFIEGPTLSAQYVAADGRARLLGVVLQQPGAPGAPFLYRGGIGPWNAPEVAMIRLQRIGGALASDFRLVGLFGVDFILEGGEPRPVEVNPRYTASVEILELASRRALLRDHVSACADGRSTEDRADRAAQIVGKRILYASRRIVAPTIAVPVWSHDDPFNVPPIADVPWPGTVVDTLDPIMTVFATAPTADACAASLDRIEAEWMERLEHLCESE